MGRRLGRELIVSSAEEEKVGRNEKKALSPFSSQDAFQCRRRKRNAGRRREKRPNFVAKHRHISEEKQREREEKEREERQTQVSVWKEPSHFEIRANSSAPFSADLIYDILCDYDNSHRIFSTIDSIEWKVIQVVERRRKVGAVGDKGGKRGVEEGDDVSWEEFEDIVAQGKEAEEQKRKGEEREGERGKGVREKGVKRRGLVPALSLSLSDFSRSPALGAIQRKGERGRGSEGEGAGKSLPLSLFNSLASFEWQTAPLIRRMNENKGENGERSEESGKTVDAAALPNSLPSRPFSRSPSLSHLVHCQVIQHASWRFLCFSGTYSVKMNCVEDRKRKRVMFKLLEKGMLSKFEGEWRVHDAGTERAKEEAKGKSLALGLGVESKREQEGERGEGCVFSFSQQLLPAFVPPGPIAHYVIRIIEHQIRGVGRDVLREAMEREEKRKGEKKEVEGEMVGVLK